jgi:hypothetical protein
MQRCRGWLSSILIGRIASLIPKYTALTMQEQSGRPSSSADQSFHREALEPVALYGTVFQGRRDARASGSILETRLGGRSVSTIRNLYHLARGAGREISVTSLTSGAIDQNSCQIFYPADGGHRLWLHILQFIEGFSDVHPSIILLQLFILLITENANLGPAFGNQ